MSLVIVGCSRRKRSSSSPLPALELYQGWCVPLLRDVVAGRPDRLSHVRILSARHGLLPATTPLMPYDQPLSRRRAARLRPQVRRALRAEVAPAADDEVLLLLEPRYLSLLGLPHSTPGVRSVHWFGRPVEDWQSVRRVLTGWGWT